MARTTPTKLVILQDRSGSMSNIQAATVKMLNQLIKEQKKVPGECEFQLLEFPAYDPTTLSNYAVETILECPLSEARTLTYEDLIPQGGTPLMEATLTTLEKIQRELDGGPGRVKVILIICTDGEANATNLTPEVARQIKQRGDDGDGWEIIYLGANQNALDTGKRMGIAEGKSLTYMANGGGIAGMTGALNDFIRNVRVNTTLGLADVEFTEADRQKAMGGRK